MGYRYDYGIITVFFWLADKKLGFVVYPGVIDIDVTMIGLQRVNNIYYTAISTAGQFSLKASPMIRILESMI